MPKRLCTECKMPALTNVREIGCLCTVAYVRTMQWDGNTYRAKRLAERDNYSRMMA